MRRWKTFYPENKNNLRIQLLNFASQFETFSFLDSCNNKVYGNPTFDFLLAAGTHDHMQLNVGNAFHELKEFIDQKKDWCFGYFGYDLKNETEKLVSQNFDGLLFPDMYFFIPEVLIIVKEHEISIGSYEPAEDTYEKINNCPTTFGKKPLSNLALQARMQKKDYIETVNKIRRHIIDGDIYELNFCQEFYAREIEMDTVVVFEKLCEKSKAPFSVLMKMGDKYLISSSPERFLKKEQNKLFSQPMKGTIGRNENKIGDEYLRNLLAENEKEKAENVMIVDLVRNDLAKSAKPGSIKVDELFGIYSFEHVHQMVSTVSAELKEGIHPVDAIKNGFPMGSMTGAPKVMAMQLIEKYEDTKRGLFSGAVGYIDADMNFDFNVVIRSMLYNATQKYLSIQVGSAIVYDSDPESEYEECIMKLKGLLDVLQKMETKL
ncbi:MAG: anthranilate synthase component I family protein [Chitinophagales bacterium]